MGLYGGMNAAATDSVPIFLVVTAATWFSHLRYLLSLFLHFIGFLHLSPQDCEDGILGVGLARIAALAEELQKNPSFGYGPSERERVDEERQSCVVCLCGLREGEGVRKLGCNHVFHKSCLDGWLRLLNLNCPICRAPLMEEEVLKSKERRISRELLLWFS